MIQGIVVSVMDATMKLSVATHYPYAEFHCQAGTLMCDSSSEH